jgi:hypothetical protein
MSYPITTNDVADLLEFVGRPRAAETVRWSDRNPDRRHLDEMTALRQELEETRADLQHAVEDADAAWNSLCKRCRAKREAS